MISTERYDHTNFNLLQADWNRLTDANADLTIFQRFEWLESWWRAFQDGQELYILAIREGETLIGLAPLMRKTLRLWGFPVLQIGFIADEVSDYCRLIAAPGREAEVSQAALEYMQAHRNDWHILRFNEMPESALAAISEGVGAFTFPFSRKEAGKTFRIPTRTQSWDIYWENISKRLRVKFERQRRLLGEYELKMYSGAEITPERVAQITELNHRIPIAKRAGSIFLNESYRRFHCDYLFNSTLREYIVLAVLYLGPKPVAYHYSFCYKDRLCVYNVNYDDLFRRFSLGLFMDIMSAKNAFESGYIAIDYLRGDYQFKKSYNTLMSQNYEATIFRSRFVQMAYQTFRQAYETARKIYAASIVPMKRGLQMFAGNLPRYRLSLKDNGFKQYLEIMFSFLFRKLFIFGSSYFMRANRQVLAALEDGRRQAPEGISFRELTLSDYPLFGEFMTRKSMTIMVSRFWSGDWCWGALDQGRLVGYCWMTAKDTSERNLRIKIHVAEDELYLYDGMIDSHYRGRGLMPLLLKAISQAEKVKRFLFITGVVSVKNTPMIKVMRNLEFRIETRVDRMKIFFVNTETRRKLTFAG